MTQIFGKDLKKHPNIIHKDFPYSCKTKLLHDTIYFMNKILDKYDPENFRKTGYQVIDLLADYLKQVTAKKVDNVSTLLTPEEMLSEWPKDFSNNSQADITKLLKKVVIQSAHLHHPCYLGHQVSSPLPIAALCDLVASFLNNPTALFEMGPVTTAMEKILINWMSKLIGFNTDADGFFTSGGTLGNLTALLAARQAKAGYDVWKEGIKNTSNLVILASEQSHYSIKKTSQIIGLGEKGVVPIPTDENFCMDVNALKQKYKEIVEKGDKVIAVVSGSCVTATGSYDPLDLIADFCEENNLWLHVDGAHGASALLSDKYKGLLKGIDRADSVVWDAHKMLLMPSLITAVIFKNSKNSYQAFSQEASYIFEKGQTEEWYNLIHRTFECTKTMMCLKLYAGLSIYGEDFFANYVTSMYDLTKKFAQLIKEQPDFELAVEPQSNIICFRYVPQDFEGDINILQKTIRNKILKKSPFYIVKVDLNNKTYLRCTVINPLTTENEIRELLALIKDLGINL